MRITVTLVQMDAAMGKVAENLEWARQGVAEAGRRNSDLVLLPELWHAGLDYARVDAWAAGLSEGPFVQMGEMARSAGVYLAGSAFERAARGQFHNTLAVFTPAGECVSVYRKVHLFPPMDEPRYLQAGDRPVCVDFPWGRAGLAVCYDLRFPELFRRYAVEGANLILLPAQWPASRCVHWRTLTQARAIENQAFLCACNRAGRDGEGPFGGHSVVCDPWGDRTLEAGLEPALLTVEIDLAAVAGARERLNVLAGRRPEVYDWRPAPIR